MSIIAALHNLYLVGIPLTPWLLLPAAYGLLSLPLVRLIYPRWRPVAILFLVADVAMMAVAVGLTGGERSWLFLLPLFRVIDQTHTTFRRAMMFGHVAAASYALLLGWLELFAGHHIYWPGEVVKLAMLYVAVVYTALTARSSDENKKRTAAAMVMLRDSVNSLEVKSEMLEESRRRLQRLMHENELILESAGEGIVGFDIDGKITFVNSRAAKTVGYSAAELQGKQGHDLAVHTTADGKICDGSNCPLLAVLISGAEERGENPGFYKRDGTVVPVEYTSEPMYEGGQLVGAVFSFRDISERREVQRALVEARNAAEAASRAKSHFLANMSHELRTPLNAIIGYSEMLHEELAGSEPALAADVEKIRKAGSHLLGLISAILEIARIEAGRNELVVEPCEGGSLAREVAAEAAAAAREAGNTLTTRCDSAAPLETDSAKVRRILGILLDNANKFTRDGSVGVEVTRDKEGAVTFSVTDTGMGIDPSHRAALFESFVQGDGSATRRHGGSGLGLAIAHRLTSMLGGTIEVASEPGRGSSFMLRLPPALSPEITTQDPQHGSANFSMQELG